jgi:hypothetical protein
MKMGQTGRYFDRRRALSPLVDRTMIPPAFMSKLARTAAMAHDSTMLTGRSTRFAELLEVRDVGNGILGLQASLMHLADSFVGIVTLSSLTRQHDTVGSISDSIADVADFSTGRARIVDHRLEHLSSTDDGLAGDVAHSNHLLLSCEIPPQLESRYPNHHEQP